MKIHRLKGIASTRNVWLDGEFLNPIRSQKYRNHSPDGFNWGYGGSGPAQLALAIVLKLRGKSDGYQDFKFKFIAGLPQNEDFDIEFDLDDYFPLLKKMTHKVIDLVYHEDEGNEAFVGTEQECYEWVSEQGFGYQVVALTVEEIEYHTKFQ